MLIPIKWQWSGDDLQTQWTRKENDEARICSCLTRFKHLLTVYSGRQKDVHVFPLPCVTLANTVGRYCSLTSMWLARNPWLAWLHSWYIYHWTFVACSIWQQWNLLFSWILFDSLQLGSENSAGHAKLSVKLGVTVLWVGICRTSQSSRTLSGLCFNMWQNEAISLSSSFK